MELVSVIMPTYNVEKYVGEAIESILNQTYENFEFIIVDDCSTDSTYEICKKYANQDSRIKLYKNSENLKISKTLNFALSKSTGKYILRMDGDDISVPDRIEKMKVFLDANPKVKLVGTSAITIDSEGKELGKTKFLDSIELINKTCTLKTPVAHIWMTYKSVYDELDGYRLVNPSEDFDFVLRCLTKGYLVSNISDFYAYKIRINREGNSTNLFGLKKLLSHAYTVRKYKERLSTGKDTFSVEQYNDAIKTSKLSEKLYLVSNKFLYKAINCKAEKNIIGVVFFTILSTISPYQIAYLFRTNKYKYLVKKGK